MSPSQTDNKATPGAGPIEVPQGLYRKHPSEPHITGISHYRSLYSESIQHPDFFWSRFARQLLDWDKEFRTARSGSLANGDTAWFLEGRLNASYNCVDRHAINTPSKPAIIYVEDADGQTRVITYSELLRSVCKLSYVLRDMGVAKGHTVSIYMPMVPEALIAMLACARIGAVHSVVFAGFSAEALQGRILDAGCKLIITSDEARRAGKPISMKTVVDQALKFCPGVTGCLVFKRTGLTPTSWISPRDRWWHEEVEKWPGYMPPEDLPAEHPLFLLYTSGSTGKPKGLVHTTAGYLLGAAASTKYVFDLHEQDVFFCAGDIGWITGHTYLCYGPLLLGSTTIVCEGTPTFPSPFRYWNIIEKHQVTHFYTAPTVLRLLKKAGSEPSPNQVSKLRVLGSIGEPIAPEVWLWYYESVGKKEAHIVDTYFQTETGCHALAPLAGVTSTKPGCASVPFFGVDPVIIDPISGTEIVSCNQEGYLAFRQPWPSMARSVWGDHTRFIKTYFNQYKGYYLTGDGAYRDSEGDYWICGRIDDVINVSGHRLSTAELEAALLEHPAVSEAAVVGVSDEMTGQALSCFVSIKDGHKDDSTLNKTAISYIRKAIGGFATPKYFIVVSDIPKTRSGKIMRRILRKIFEGEKENFGDVSTLINPASIQTVIEEVETFRKA
ncbi:acetyl-coenzyme A synthetase [Periconia macrospinosa]|uniref:Acetyl-coenzyme A synthetase n=1 Tax=Periconia macrospinosa TaxID=97972 RepID=A0A2V1DFR7_9PLEO|nr:acetyl-coenzyme A synthetase [Periconia macrospinosa]